MKECIPYFIKSKRKIIIYLHGGPFFEIKTPLEDPFATFFSKKENLILLNYPIKTGEGGKKDFDWLYSTFKKLKSYFPNYKFYLIGESYGAYLCSLFSQFSIFEKIICISGFSSIQYQQLFSSEKSWLISYLSPNAIDLLYLVQHNMIKTKIYLINGDQDITTPFQQITTLNCLNASSNLITYILKGFNHRERGAKLEKVIKLINGILYSTTE
ncbi:MAG: hypothetical protein N4R24_01075 [Lactobacillus iners]|jgi:hypothetical protein|uniref:alpha/beta hydrolase family protein n=1 Tax=Lactobacillus iners TaxID=147802 RepID=UPI00020723CC|nr:hypothetical protein [Lactobacillus iners]EGG31945.1 hypothetical protein HMPREF9210_0086 [Lactobacillus iners SPIN 1401G]MCT7682059.1 hypothetical protein [Lactobacillus iners]MCT7719145.1 hypothetical protein [Lactobacillus iners]MCT7800573.1 hypothetical protein [Lactobacillus iners]MCT7834709.1 hypothetical protein [Lactobacillus iners]